MPVALVRFYLTAGKILAGSLDALLFADESALYALNWHLRNVIVPYTSTT